jgi:hypothetical protein
VTAEIKEVGAQVGQEKTDTLSSMRQTLEDIKER